MVNALKLLQLNVLVFDEANVLKFPLNNTNSRELECFALN
jgi:hypothetical protein